MVQAHLRWKTASSMEIYARYQPHLYAAEVDEALRKDTRAVPVDLPVLDAGGQAVGIITRQELTTDFYVDELLATSRPPTVSGSMSRPSFAGLASE